MQAYLVHELVHDECGAGHVSGVLQQGNEQIENQDVGQEYQHAAHSSDDAVDHHVLEHTLRHGGGHEGSEFLHKPLNPGHRVFAQAESGLEDDVKQQDEYRKGGPAVCDHRIDFVGNGMLLLDLGRSICLFQCSLHEGVFCVYDGGLCAGAAEQSLDAPVLLEAGCDDLVVVGQGLYGLFHIRVILQILDCQPAGGVMGADVLILPYQVPDAVDAGLQLLSVVDVDVAGHSRVVVLVDVNDGVEQLVYALAAAAHRRDYGHTEQMSQGDGVELVSACLQLVVHIQGHYHAEVHVNDLGGQVEVPLQVGGIHHIDDHVGNILDQVLADVQFLRAVGREGVGAGQIHQDKAVALVLKMPLFSIDCDTAVVAYMLV